MRRWQSLLVLATVAVGGIVVLTACGGSGGKQLSKQEFLKQANAICKDATAAGNAVSPPTKAAEFSNYAKAAEPLLEKELVDLRRLKPPTSLEADVNAWLATGDEAVKALDKMIQVNGDEAKITELLGQANSSAVKSDALGKKLGLTQTHCVG